MIGYLYPDNEDDQLESLEIIIDVDYEVEILSSEKSIHPFEIEGRIIKGSACDPSVKGVIHPPYKVIRINTNTPEEKTVEFEILETWIYPNRKKIKIHVIG